MGISITNHGPAFDWQSSTAYGYILYASKGGCGAFHNPSPHLTLGQMNSAIANARVSQATFASNLPTAAKRWFGALDTDTANGVFDGVKHSHKLDPDDNPPTP